MNLAFDTLTAAKKMEEVGMERKQAEVLSHIIAERQGDLVTKADIADMATKADIAILKADIANCVTKAEFAEMKAEFAEMKGDLKSVKDSDNRHWKLTLYFMVPALLLIFGTIVGFGFTALNMAAGS